MEQIEQDLLLSRLIAEVANDDYLSDELVFRGGTCLHKLHAPEPLRYSEDLDYVRSTGGGIGEVTRGLTQIGKRLGIEVRTRLTEHPKGFLRAPYETGAGPMRIKIEVNTFEVIRRRGPWKGLDDVEYATLEWVDWFNHRRLLEPIGDIPPAEYETN